MDQFVHDMSGTVLNSNSIGRTGGMAQFATNTFNVAKGQLSGAGPLSDGTMANGPVDTSQGFDTTANAGDPILVLVPPERRATLIASREDRDGHPTYVFDIRLHGDGETVFFDI